MLRRQSRRLPTLIPDDRFEAALRNRERAGIASRVTSARAWYSATRDIRAAGAATAAVVPAVGDMIRLNVNAVDFCDSADYRDARVVAVTDKAIVVADVANPVGGFTDDEYRSMGVTFDTLVDPVDRAAFGDVTDIDNNGHVILFFTRAVNELTPPGASSIVLGFFYSRDLLPKTAAPGPCSGSNVAEMFYLHGAGHRRRRELEQALQGIGRQLFQRNGGARIPAFDQRLAPAVRQRRRQRHRGEVARRRAGARRRGAQLLPRCGARSTRQPGLHRVRRSKIRRGILHV